jgi:hypothetical protein
LIFAVSVGSDGKGIERFVLYLPFSFAPGRIIGPIDSSISHCAGGYEARVEKLVNFYALTIGVFRTESDALNFFPKLRSSLLWASLKDSVGISFPKSLANVRLRNTPASVPESGIIAEVIATVGWDTIDGDYNADEAVARPQAKKLLRWEMGRASLSQTIGVSSFIGRISEALAFEYTANVLYDEKLQLAIDLYSSFFFEISENAQFITLVTVLEALTPDSEIPETGKETLKALKKLITEDMKKVPTDSEKWKHLEHLRNRVGGLKKQSISFALKDYVAKIVHENPCLGTLEEIAAQLRDIYNTRSLLLHTGAADEGAVKDSLEFLRSFVPRLLEQLYRSVANRIPALSNGPQNEDS